jgi:transposase
MCATFRSKAQTRSRNDFWSTKYKQMLHCIELSCISLCDGLLHDAVLCYAVVNLFRQVPMDESCSNELLPQVSELVNVFVTER